MSQTYVLNALYETPITTRSNSLYLATADVTLGILDENSGQELIFFEASLGAECGLKTTYKVTFDYGEIHSMNQTDCAEFGPDGVCIQSDQKFVSRRQKFCRFRRFQNYFLF